jgi:NhaP-type Na+/H+ or K+/H+ antiporter
MLELGGVIILGILAQWVAWRIKVPAILPLLLIGLVVGPLSTLWTVDGTKLLEPVWNGTKGIFPKEHLFHFVELAIGVILFEGGLSLKRDELKGVGPSIINLISLGSLVTFIGGALMAHYITGLHWDMSFLFSGLIIVTGPTVIGPILRNLTLKRNISAILKWEGILIDPIGALTAVLVYEFIHLTHSPAFGGGGAFTVDAFKHFLLIALVGSALGFFLAHLLRICLQRHWVPHYLLTVFTLAFVLAGFVGSHLLVPDSGLLTVVVLGMVVGNVDMPHKNEIIYFGESLSILLIAILFILLSANMNIADLELLLNWKVAALFLAVIFVLRPIGVFLSTFNSALTINEKLFISWVGPRGIVAAGIASLFGSKLAAEGISGAEYITPFVFMIVLGTVILNATGAGLIAKWLGVLLEKSNGILVVGAHRASRLIGKYLKENGKHVILIDSNTGNIEKAHEEGIDAYTVDIYKDDLRNNSDLNDVGILMAMTGSAEVNDFSIDNLKKDYGENGSYRLTSVNELQNPETVGGQNLFSKHDDFINLLEVARDYPVINEIEVDTYEILDELLKKINSQDKTIPLFVKNGETDDFSIVLSDYSGMKVGQGDKLVYMGKTLKAQETPVLNA